MSYNKKLTKFNTNTRTLHLPEDQRNEQCKVNPVENEVNYDAVKHYPIKECAYCLKQIQ